MEERFERITRLATRLLGTPIAAITLIDGHRQWIKSAQGFNAAQTPRDVSFCGHTILGEEPLIVPDATRDERFHDNPFVRGEPGIRFYAGHPVHSPDGQRVGSLCVIDSKPRDLTPQEIEDLRDLAAMVEDELKSNALAVAQAEMNMELEKARKAVMVDPLTRLWNRAGADEFLRRQHRLAIERREKFCVGMADIDHFKAINDTHGHPVGDEVLRSVARRILRGIRPNDFACRMGGEEFLLVLANPSASEARAIAQRVREEVRREPVAAGGNLIPVTISLGLAFYDPAGCASIEEVIQHADDCLYRAKQAGRDRVVAHFEEAGGQPLKG
ncbi:MAG: sensor domain-containing diguanylate cyclase [Terrimicrobiaceae bacterium]|nr:sensor domain-containing diguanylate cyclase [Terrimicrobiaceae bacterium]